MKKIIDIFWNKIVKTSDQKRIESQQYPQDVNEEINVEYLPDGHAFHKLDIYRPEELAKQKLPIIINVHGGGWYYGDKELNKYFCMELSKNCFAVASLSYRISPEATFETQLSDVIDAINYLKERSETFNLDFDNCFITGDSAGGHIASIICAMAADENLRSKFGKEINFNVKAGGFICACFNPYSFSKKIGMTAYFNDVFGKGYKNREITKYYDFDNCLSKNICPCFLTSNYGDMLKGETLRTYSKLKNEGIDTELYFFDKLQSHNKLTHVFNVLEPFWQDSKTVNNAMCEFFKKRMTN